MKKLDFDLSELDKALHYLHVAELRDVAIRLSLPEKGKKMELIKRIMHFVETGQVMQEAAIPKVSRAVRGSVYPLKPETLILKGAYKNDLATRLFFKGLIGDYFHYTAFGIDWINERWLLGNPPTYKEFADMWRDEYKRCQERGSQPKPEWAFINFTQNLIRENPNILKETIHQLWAEEHSRQVEIVNRILRKVKPL